MLLIADALRKLSFQELMAVYEEGNRENGAELFPDESSDRQICLAEQNFYEYLHESFFKYPDAIYAVWEENGKYISALRLEPFRDGFLLEALETRPTMRKKGYAAQLIKAVQNRLAEQGGGRIYSHVNKKNAASLNAHKACGFSIILDYAVYIDGSVNRRAYTLIFDA